MNTDKLKHVLDSIRTMPDLQPTPGVTHCNEAVRRAFGLMGYPNVFSKNEMANAIANQVEKDISFRMVGTNEAARAAQEGQLVIAAHKYNAHGHVAMLYPETMQISTSWDKLVPMVSNVGESIGVMKVSKAFPVSLGEPEYFVYIV